MGKSRRKHPAEGVLDLMSRLPWWACLAIGVAGYVVLHRFAATAPPAPAQPGSVSPMVIQSALRGIASAMQYVMLLLGLISAVLSFIGRKQRRALVFDVEQAHSARALDGMSWQEFEMLVGQAYALQGFRVTETGGGGADGGIDLVLTQGSELFLVQCKQWKAQKVGVAVVRELYGLMAAKGAAGGFVVTSGRFTEEAQAFASGRHVQLVDGPRLLAMLAQAKASRSQAPVTPAPASDVAFATASPACPQCGAQMVKRTARRGNHAGKVFWGCSGYPTCKGVRALD